MESRFKVVGAYALDARNLLVLPGEMLEGRIMSGMVAELGEEGAPRFLDRVHSVEFFEDERSSGYPSVTFEYRDAAQLEEWTAIDWPGEVLRLHF